MWGGPVLATGCLESIDWFGLGWVGLGWVGLGWVGLVGGNTSTWIRSAVFPCIVLRVFPAGILKRKSFVIALRFTLFPEPTELAANRRYRAPGTPSAQHAIDRLP